MTGMRLFRNLWSQTCFEYQKAQLQKASARNRQAQVFPSPTLRSSEHPRLRSGLGTLTRPIETAAEALAQMLSMQTGARST